MYILRPILRLQLLFLPLALAVWPQPLQVRYGSSVLWMAEDVQLQYQPRRSWDNTFWKLWSVTQRAIPFV